MNKSAKSYPICEDEIVFMKEFTHTPQTQEKIHYFVLHIGKDYVVPCYFTYILDHCSLKLLDL